jgi:hypothetical protein
LTWHPHLHAGGSQRTPNSGGINAEPLAQPRYRPALAVQTGGCRDCCRCEASLAQSNPLSSEQSGDGRAMDLESPRQLPDRLSLVVCGDELRDLCLAEAVLALSRALSVLPSSLRRGSRTQVAEPRSIPKKVRIEAHKLRYLAPGQAPFVVVL